MGIDRKITTILKYAFSILLIIASFSTTGNYKTIVIGLIELALIFLICNLILNYGYKKIGFSANCILLFVLNTQYAILLWAGTFLQWIMVTNLSSIEALGGNAVKYIATAVCVLVFSLLPIKKIEAIPNIAGILILLIVEVALCMTLVSYTDSAFLSLNDVIKAYVDEKNFEKTMDQIAEAYPNEFLKDSIKDAQSKPDNLCDNPNVIVIFTEGLSEDIILDDRDIMPFLKEFRYNCLRFDNYYNHTEATYRSIIGQLSSGYQFKNSDRSNLPSIQSILSKKGYTTSFINVEPKNKEYTKYLEDLGFDSVVNCENSHGISNTATDEEAYENLIKLMNTMDDKQPFFISMYTIGTHVSFHSDGQEYGDGENKYLNKFYNNDYCFSKFIEYFDESEFADNTIIIYTSDHATYVDKENKEAFPEGNMYSFVGEIPFYVYYKGIEPQVIDANGRNSLDFAPTILDYIDISATNRFLGNSLFDEEITEFDTYNSHENITVNTAGGVIRDLTSEEDERVYDRMLVYFSIKKKSVE